MLDLRIDQVTFDKWALMTARGSSDGWRPHITQVSRDLSLDMSLFSLVWVPTPEIGLAKKWALTSTWIPSHGVSVNNSPNIEMKSHLHVTIATNPLLILASNNMDHDFSKTRTPCIMSKSAFIFFFK